MEEQKKFQCPEKELEKLATVLTRTIFRTRFIRPSLEEIAERLRKQAPNTVDEFELGKEGFSAYQDANARYESYYYERKMVLKYAGITKEPKIEEELEHLRISLQGIMTRHVRDCKKCRFAANDFIEEKSRLAQEMFEISKFGNYEEAEHVKFLYNLYFPGLMEE